MSGMSRCLSRGAGLVVAAAALALIVAPAAWANADTITAAAGVNFNGVVDQSPTCSDAKSITIHWGDGSTTAGRPLSDGASPGVVSPSNTPMSVPRRRGRGKRQLGILAV